MLSMDDCQLLIHKHINEIELPELPSNLYHPIRYILNLEAKRVRPSLVLMSSNLFSDDVQNAISVALAVEVFHNFTLIHDDIMDESELRRNHPTVHMKWNADIALLSGDAMVIKAYELLFDTDKSLLMQLYPVFNKTALAVCEGQQHDMDYETRDHVNVDEYLVMIEKKTAVLIAASLKMGAICGGAGQLDSELMYDFGKNIGIAFQLQDDLLDVFADTEIFGKKCGNDIVSNKKTFMLIEALSRAGANEKKELIFWLNKKDFDRDEKIKTIRSIYKTLGVDILAKQCIELYHQKAMDSLNKVSVPADRKKMLLNFSNNLMHRKK